LVEVEVRTADAARRHAHDGVGRLFDLRVGHGFHPDVAPAVPRDCLHAGASRSKRRRTRCRLERTRSKASRNDAYRPSNASRPMVTPGLWPMCFTVRAILYTGKLVEVADSASVYENPRHPYTEAHRNGAGRKVHRPKRRTPVTLSPAS